MGKNPRDYTAFALPVALAAAALLTYALSRFYLAYRAHLRELAIFAEMMTLRRELKVGRPVGAPAAMTGRGLLVVLEGIDGAGTTTQAERISAALRADGHRVVTTRQPSDGPVGMLIRQVLAGRLQLPGGSGPISPQTLALLYAADRTDHLDAQLHPALEAARW